MRCSWCGIREKVIAARRVKIYDLILPHANKRDFEDLPDYIREGVQVRFVKQYFEVAEILWGTATAWFAH
ncbi:MAG: S16 family serine protease [Thiotrichaceae bacterium]